MEISDFRCCNTWVVPVEGSGPSFLHLANFTAQLWKRETDCDGVARCVLGGTIELDKLLPLSPEDPFVPMIFGFAEEDNVSFIVTSSGIFMVQLESMQFKKPSKCSTSNTIILSQVSLLLTAGIYNDATAEMPKWADLSSDGDPCGN
ncbi:hypothetical protein ACP70R_029359 [Stipagrostis hirtigluma subsp. patula]